MSHDNEAEKIDLLDREDDVDPLDEVEAPEEFEISEEIEEEAERESDGPVADDTRAPRAPRDRAFIVASAIAAVFALLFVVVAVLLVHERNSNKSDSERTTVETTASRVAEALVSVNANGDQSGSETVRALGTGPLVQQFDEANAAVRGSFGPLKIQSISGKVKEVYLKEIDGSEADVIVVLDLVIVGDNPRVDQDHYLRVHLAKLNGTWKVDNVQDVNLALAGTVSGNVNGSGAPSTTAPATGSTPQTAPPASSSSSP